jgi:hypothetical protein
MEHPVQWTAASPMWPALTSAADPNVRRAFNAPSLLRFAADSFMDDFTAMLDVDPMRLGELAARPETWRGPAPSVTPTPAAPLFARALQRKRLAALRRTSAAATTTSTAPTATLPSAALPPVLKLYQPSHQRFYLVCGSLVCQLPGLPDRAIDAGAQERATFVLRRLVPKPGVPLPTIDPGTADEYAFVAGPGGQGWRRIADAASRGSLIAGEDQIGLSPAAYRAEDGRRRKLLVGLVPVGKRETYLGAPSLDAAPPTGGATAAASPPPDPRTTLLQKQVIEPWRQLVARAEAIEAILSKARDATSPKSDPLPTQQDREKTRREGREQIQTASWYLLLDIARFLEEHLPNVWSAVGGTAVSLSPAETSLVTTINGMSYTRNGVATPLRSMLAAIRTREAQLEAVTQPYSELAPGGWPPELFSLAPIRSTEQLSPIPTDLSYPPPVEHLAGLTPSTLRTFVSTFETRVAAALPAVATAPMPAAPIATRPVLAPGDRGWFVIRFVYERPHCGPLHPPLVSEPTEVFQLAGFFDPDAPARPIRIALPLDISPAGLRKFDKNTAFVMSDMLCGQFDRMKGLTLADLVLSVLPWPFHKDLPGSSAGPCPDGMIVTLSIPIITLCALILLIIIVTLFNMIFSWLPFFMTTIRVPGLKAKESA